MIPQRQSGLGRGLGAIIPPKPPAAPSAPVVLPTAAVPTEKPVPPPAAPVTPPEEEPETTTVVTSALGLREVPLDSVERNPYQPRTHFDHNELEELIKSIEEHGMLQP